jgi:hypothetical protein
MLNVGEGIQDTWESFNVHYKVTLLRYDACAHIIHLLVHNEVYTGLYAQMVVLSVGEGIQDAGKCTCPF